MQPRAYGDRSEGVEEYGVLSSYRLTHGRPVKFETLTLPDFLLQAISSAGAHKTWMETQELDKECPAFLASLGSESWIGNTRALTEVVVGLEAELGFWSGPFQFSVDSPLLPFVMPESVDTGIDQAASTLLHSTSSPCSTACFPGDGTSSTPAGQSSPTPLSSQGHSGDNSLAGKGKCSLSLAIRAEGSEAFQLPLTAAQGLPSLDYTHDAFWNMPWDDAAIQLCGADVEFCTATTCSPSHSLNLDSCQTIFTGKRDAPANLLWPVQRAGSADSEASCAFAAEHPVNCPVPNLVCLPEAPIASFAEAIGETAAVPTSSSGTAAPLTQANRHTAPDQALGRPASPPAADGRLPCTPTDPSRSQPFALPAPTAQLAAEATLPTGAAPVGLVAQCVPAIPLSHRQQPGRPRPLATVLKVRQQQQAYNQRRKVREAAVHAHAGVLKERLAALEGDVSALLGRHEVLTREQPWHQQHEEIFFMAGLASLLPQYIGGRSSSASFGAAASDPIQKFMLEPTATVSTLCHVDPTGSPDVHQSLDIWETQTTTQPAIEDPGPLETTNIAWTSILACLRLTKAQKDDIAALYKEHLQEAAATHQICLSIASKVQVLPSVNGKLIDCTWPSMAGSLVSSQLSSLAAREEDMVASLTAACHEVLSPIQQQSLQVLAPEAAKEDLRAMCREICAACTAPRKASASSNAKPAQPQATAAQSPTAAPQEAQVMSCHKTSCKKDSGTCGEGSIPPQAAIIHAAAPAAAGNGTAIVPAVNDDIIRTAASTAYMELLAVVETRGIAALQNAPLWSPTNAQPVRNDITDDMTPVPAWTQLASLEKVKPAVNENAMPAVAVAHACNVALEDTALKMDVAQLAAVPSEAAIKYVTAAPQHKRQAAVCPEPLKAPFGGISKRLPTKGMAMPEEAAPQVSPYEHHRKKARKMRSLWSLHQSTI